MARSKGDRCLSTICTFLFFIYVIFGFWFGTSDLFVLRYGSCKMFTVTWYGSDSYRAVVNFNDLHHGEMMCFTKEPAFLLDQRFGSDVKDNEIYQCYFEEDNLYFSNWTSPQTNMTSCFYQGTGISFNGKIPKRAKSYDDKEICKTRDSKRKVQNRISSIKYTNKSIHHCTLQRYYERGMFYTDPVTAERIEKADLADCVEIVSKMFTIFLFSAWCLRIFLYPLLMQLCVGSKCKSAVFCVISCSYETGTLIVSIILPFLYRSHTLTITTQYNVMLVGNIVIFVITVLVWFLVACIGDCNRAVTSNSTIEKKKKKRLVKVWKAPPLTPAVSQSMIPEIILLEHRRSSGMEELGQVKDLVLGLWNSNRVGIGRDARGLNHKNIEIVGVTKMDTPISQQYINRKKDMISYARCLPNEKVELDYKENSEPVLTIKQLDDNNSTIKDLVNNSINEVFLFHGTRTVNIASIKQNGFDVKKSRSNFVGNGIYFAESPVKADQYTDKSSLCTMILARVLLGKTIVLQDNIFMNESQGPPCSTCLKINCKKKHRPRRRPFDSVVLDKPRGLFREFVVYENCLAHPDYLITYKRT